MHWPDKLKKGVEGAQIVLVLIANKYTFSGSGMGEWLAAGIDDPDDWVRQEVETALAESSEWRYSGAV
jgi:hypothetical protein